MMQAIVFSLIVLLTTTAGEGRPSTSEDRWLVPKYYEKYILSLGDASAPIRVYKFFSFTCLSCLLFHQHHFPSIKKQFIDTGKVYWTFVPYVMDVDTLYVMAATAQRDNPTKLKIFQTIMHQARYWTDDDNKDKIIKILEVCGIAKLNIQACFAEETYEAVLRDAFNFQQTIKIDGTPTLFVNNKEIPGVPDSKKLTKILTDLLKEEKGSHDESNS